MTNRELQTLTTDLVRLVVDEAKKRYPALDKDKLAKFRVGCRNGMFGTVCLLEGLLNGKIDPRRMK